MKYHDAALRKSLWVSKIRLPEEKGSAQVRLMVLGAVLAMALLTGCASPHLRSDSDLLNYNSDTGYPAVGGPRWVSL